MSTQKTCAAGRVRGCAQRRGFTLVEVMIVLAIGALITSMTISGFSSLSEGNRRTTCQTNLSQLYASMRLYAADEGAFPFYGGTTTAAATSGSGIGLWALYTFPDTGGSGSDFLAPVGTKPIERYVRGAKILHCPADMDPARDSLYNSDKTLYNMNYLSYQVKDPANPTVLTYKSVRTTTFGDPDWKRQLLHFNGTTRAQRPPADDTVVTWCPFHRAGGRSYDNVLFYDGSVQLLPSTQEDGRTGWQRLPKVEE